MKLRRALARIYFGKLTEGELGYCLTPLHTFFRSLPSRPLIRNQIIPTTPTVS